MNIKIIFCLLALTVNYNCLSMLAETNENEEEPYEQFEQTPLGEAQKGIFNAFKHRLAIQVKMQTLATKFCSSRTSFSKEEQKNITNIQEKIISRLDDAKRAYDAADAIIRNDSMSLTKTHVHIEYTDKFLKEAKQLLDRYEQNINFRIPEQPSPANPKAKL